MSYIPTWVTPAGSLGTIPEGVFYSVPLVAEASSTVYYQVIAGSLPPGIQINETGILSGNPNAQASVEGVPLDVLLDTTSKFAVRAYTEQTVNGVKVINGLADRTFTLTISGQRVVQWTTPAGLIGTYVDGTQISDLSLDYQDSDVYSIDVVTLVSGSLPPGLTVSPSGVISGYITPNTKLTPTAGYSNTSFDQYSFDFPQAGTDTTYTFTLKVSNGVTSDTRTFSIKVYARNLMTADNTHITADNTFVTADLSPTPPPIITTPQGNIGSTRSDNFYAFQFTALDFYGDPFTFEATTDLPPGLTLDPNSGWLYGYIPYGGVFSADYSFSIRVRLVEHPLIVSDPYDYSLSITGPVNADVVWLTSSDLGVIDNGATSTFYITARNVSGIPLQYRLASGSDSRLPQGLQLLASGNIAGRVSFDTFALDGGTTTFDVGLNTVQQPTTFDMVATFTVNAYSIDEFVNVNKTFSIRVIRRYDEPYDNLYIQAMPPRGDRALLSDLLQNPSIFPPNMIYRNDDPYFGVSQNVVYNHAYGLTATTINDYVKSLELNHYWKNLTLGEIKTAQALDDNGDILYEVVYSQVVDNLVNTQGESVAKEVLLSYPIYANTPEQVDIVYPNSLQDMRTQVIDTVGQISNVLPRWMLSRQVDGTVLGFTPAWVIAYTKPNQSGQIAYNIKTYFSEQLNLIDFKADRYELDNFLTKNWNRDEQYWGYTGNSLIPHPATLTTFDYTEIPSTGTTFDGNSLLFTAPVDMYSPPATTDYDRYLLFPKSNIITNLPYVVSDQVPVYWVNNYGEFVNWVNNSDRTVNWVTPA